MKPLLIERLCPRFTSFRQAPRRAQPEVYQRPGPLRSRLVSRRPRLARAEYPASFECPPANCLVGGGTNRVELAANCRCKAGNTRLASRTRGCLSLPRASGRRRLGLRRTTARTAASISISLPDPAETASLSRRSYTSVLFTAASRVAQSPTPCRWTAGRRR